MSSHDRKRKTLEVQKQKILGAALKMFANSGLGGTTITAIAKEAGVSHGLVHHYFETKERLFTSVMDGVLDFFRSARRIALEGEFITEEALRRWIYMITIGLGQKQIFELFSRLVMQILGTPALYQPELVNKIYEFSTHEVNALQHSLINLGLTNDQAFNQACLAFNSLIGGQMFGMRQQEHLELLYHAGCKMLGISDSSIPDKIFLSELQWVFDETK